MPLLKVFLSSTCYDFSLVRQELGLFIRALGHEPVMSECADVLYDPQKHTHASCVEEVSKTDILVLLIGGRFGGTATYEALSMIDFEKLKYEVKEDLLESHTFSITHLEVLKAIECGIPVYTFIENNVYNEHKIYEKNKNKAHVIHEITFPSIDKQETARYIFEFINIVRLRNHGNNIFPFKSLDDIKDVLRKQWSAYFQKLIKENSESQGAKLISKQEKDTKNLRKMISEIISEYVKETQERALPVLNKNRYRRILWVDDYPENNETVIQFFEEQNIHFDIALTTEQGLGLYRTQLYDAIITDMGRGTERDAGINLISELRRLHCQVPIIVYCSQSAIMKYGKKAIEIGAHQVIHGITSIISLITKIYEEEN